MLDEKEFDFAPWTKVDNADLGIFLNFVLY